MFVEIFHVPKTLHCYLVVHMSLQNIEHNNRYTLCILRNHNWYNYTPPANWKRTSTYELHAFLVDTQDFLLILFYYPYNPYYVFFSNPNAEWAAFSIPQIIYTTIRSITKYIIWSPLDLIITLRSSPDCEDPTHEVVRKLTFMNELVKVNSENKFG